MNVYALILLKYTCKGVQKIVQRCIQRNAFYALPENIILTELVSSHKIQTTQIAVQIIIKGRAKNQDEASFVLVLGCIQRNLMQLSGS